MPLYHNEDQAMLAETASQFMADEGAIAKQLRHWRDRECKDGFGHALWKQFGELGFTGILVSEEDGGLGMGHVEAGIVLEEIGRNLTPSPFLTSSVLAATALGHASADLRARYLPGLVSGDSVFAVLSRYAAMFWGKGLHQTATFSADRETNIDASFWWPAVISMLGFGLFFVALVLIRTNTHIRLRRADALEARARRAA